MFEGRTTAVEEPHRRDQPGSRAETVARRLGLFNVVAGLLGLVGPAIENDDDRLVNKDPGRFLGLVAVNRRHALLHVFNGLLGLRASRDRSSARQYLKRSGAFWTTFAVVGWRAFGFEPGIHMLAGLAVDRWGNLGHTVLSGVCLSTLLRTRSSEQ